MEKNQIERRRRITRGVVAAMIGNGDALHVKQGGKDLYARDYPEGSFIIDLLEDAKKKSIRISGVLKSLSPLRLKIDPAEHSNEDLTEIQEVFKSRSHLE